MGPTRCTSRSRSASRCWACSPACCRSIPRRSSPSTCPRSPGSGYDGATVQHLLDMTAAIDFVEDYETFWRYDVACAWHPPHPDAPAETILEFLPTIGPAAWQHGERLHYSTPNTDLLGLVAERAGGAPLAELIARELWAPLGAERDALLTVDPRGHGRDRRRLLRHPARLRAARRAGAARRRRGRARRSGSRGSAPATTARSPAAPSRPRARAATGSSGGASTAAGSPAASTASCGGRPRGRRRRRDPLLLARGHALRAGARAARARQRRLRAALRASSSSSSPVYIAGGSPPEPARDDEQRDEPTASQPRPISNVSDGQLRPQVEVNAMPRNGISRVLDDVGARAPAAVDHVGLDDREVHERERRERAEADHRRHRGEADEQRGQAEHPDDEVGGHRGPVRGCRRAKTGFGRLPSRPIAKMIRETLAWLAIAQAKHADT